MTKLQKKRSCLVGALCALVLMASGCEPSKADSKLTVGKVDTAVLLQDDPEYQSLSIEYMKENTDLRRTFVDKMKAAGEDSVSRQGVQKDYKAAQQKLDAKWMAKTQDFLQSRHTEIKDSAQKIAETKSIDMVIIDSKDYPTTEWGGVDITPDLALAKTQSGSAPSASASPGKGS